MIEQPDLVTRCAREVLLMFERARRWSKLQMEQSGIGTSLSPRQFGTLYSLRREGCIAPGDLARRWRVTPAVITGVIDRLERQDLVRRAPDPLDRRRQRLELTEKGSAAAREFEQRMMDDLVRQLQLQSPAALEELDRSLRLLDGIFEALVDRAAEAEEAPAEPPCAVLAEAEPDIWRDDSTAPVLSR